MSLSDQLKKLTEEASQKMPAETFVTLLRATVKLKHTGIEAKALQVGDQAPAFVLPNHLGHPVSSAELLSRGPLVLSFYRGEWCPYCNLEINALQSRLPEMKKLGASLLAVSPETPEHSLSMHEKHALSFDVLSDQGNQCARKFGLVFTLPEELHPIYEQFGIDLRANNGDSSLQLPMPATYVIDSSGKIVKSHVDVNYATRLEPDDIIDALYARHENMVSSD